MKAAYTELLFYNARFYDPQLGRFISADTIVPRPGDPQAFNRYAYGLNNPVRYIDPTGHSVDCALGEQYCHAGKLDTARRANDLADSLGRRKIPYSQLGSMEKSILAEGQIPNEKAYDEHVQGGVSDVSEAAKLSDFVNDQMSHAPDEPIVPWLPNPHWELSEEQAEANSYFVAGWDSGTASLSAGGWALVGASAIAGDPAGIEFGYFVSQLGSAAATITWLDTLAFSGPNSYAFRVSTITYLVGWTSLVVAVPFDMAAAYAQVAYDVYTIDYGQKANTR